MAADIRDTQAYRDTLSVYRDLLRPESLWAVTDLAASGGVFSMSGTQFPRGIDDGAESATLAFCAGEAQPRRLERARLCQVEPVTGRVAWVSSEGEDNELAILADAVGAPGFARWRCEGKIEQLAWSPDGKRLLLLVADAAADVAGVQGGFALLNRGAEADWLPEVTTPRGENRWRRLWLWPIDAEAPTRITRPPFNPWEACWHDNDAVVAVASDSHDEGSWYRSALWRIPVGGDPVKIHQPEDQLGFPTASPDGKHIVWIEALCSDRGLVCGSLRLSSGRDTPKRLDTGGVEATSVHWRNNSRLLYTGLSDFETVVAELDLDTGARRQLWSSSTHTLTGWQPQAFPLGEHGALAIMESYGDAPALVELGRGAPSVRHVLGGGACETAGEIRPLVWEAEDGLEIHGWLILPARRITRPVNGWPLLVEVHGGPVSSHRQRWATNFRAIPVLVARGWAVLLPNPRGSSGRGRAFAKRVVGDMGGADAMDILAGIDQLVSEGIVDNRRVAISGSSYGGFMSCWLAATTNRFAAAVPISPVSNWTSQHFASQIPWFDSQFLGSRPDQCNGPYFERSPVFQARGMRTPSLVMAGGRDKNTPPSQAVEFYNAAREAGASTMLVVYPGGGHSLREMPMYTDSAARTVAWLEQHVPG